MCGPGARAAALLAAATLAVPRAHAQEAPGGSPRPSACASAGALEGADAGAWAAGRRGVTQYAVVGFLGGLPAGYLAPLALGAGGLGPADPSEQRLLTAGVAGVAATAAFAARRPALPADEAARLRACAPAYRDAFGEAYAARLRQRRLRAALRGGAGGAAVGLGLLFFVASQLTT